MSTLDDSTVQRILDVWFPDHELTCPTIPEATRLLWFRPSDEFDAKCSEFKPLIQDLASSYDKVSIVELATSPKRALALVILLDQISRNLFRGSRIVIEIYDPMAQAVAVYSTAPERQFDIGENGEWKGCIPCRMWFVMPYMRAESLDMQSMGRVMAEKVLQDIDNAEGKRSAEMLLVYLKEHVSVLEEFGRFPHRNEVLGRENTDSEKTWLQTNEFRWTKT
ncbi:hypothetical protein BDD12DRAFT_884316 [Trichophaea hybrida]|nr:hypothetical protein BDD12DRAFT_884316 [Trichophaea hybrida]